MFLTSPVRNEMYAIWLFNVTWLQAQWTSKMAVSHVVVWLSDCHASITSTDAITHNWAINSENIPAHTHMSQHGAATDRPTRWMYEFTSGGKSKLTILETFWKSMPREMPASLSFFFDLYQHTFQAMWHAEKSETIKISCHNQHRLHRVSSCWEVHQTECVCTEFTHPGVI